MIWIRTKFLQNVTMFVFNFVFTSHLLESLYPKNVKGMLVNDSQDEYQVETGVHDLERLRLRIVLEDPDTTIVLAKAAGHPDQDVAHPVDV